MRLLMLALATAVFAAPAWGQKLDNIGALTQEEFRLLSEDLTAAMSYRALTHAAPLGVFGLDVGIGLTGTKLKHPELLDKAVTGGNQPSTLPIPTLRARLGLPFDFDLGGVYARIESTNIIYQGADVSWAAISGGAASPALGLRASYVRMSGVEQMRLETYGLEAVISKGIGFVTPYGGIGFINAKSDPKNTKGLQQEQVQSNRFFGGVSMDIAMFSFVFEVDKTGDVSSMSGKVAIRFD